MKWGRMWLMMMVSGEEEEKEESRSCSREDELFLVEAELRRIG